ncbi:hypothetical protein [Streptomyces sp. NPDC056061]|uniref:hypothetical protein n=1 Tax=Streptomyces sp. NPDC056061 TaxID=3345700 RepID=UPI0035D885C7
MAGKPRTAVARRPDVLPSAAVVAAVPVAVAAVAAVVAATTDTRARVGDDVAGPLRNR